MSHIESVVAYDLEILEPLIRAQRAAVKSPKARGELRGLISSAPQWTSPDRKKAGRELSRLHALGAPGGVVAMARLRADPVTYLLEELDAKRVPPDHEVAAVAWRGEMPLYTPYHHLCWVADTPAGRMVLNEMDEYPFVVPASTEPMAPELAGTSELAVDGHVIQGLRSPGTGASTRVLHRPEALGGVISFLEGVLTREPPALDSYRTWYRNLHADVFTTTDASVPEAGRLVWDYARFLANVFTFGKKLMDFYRRCQRSGWGVHVYME